MFSVRTFPFGGPTFVDFIELYWLEYIVDLALFTAVSCFVD